ncbi:transposon ty3-I gag-pol polyprotein [Tanacetum coccineum]
MSNTEQPESTINEYLTKVRDDIGPGIVRPLFEENIKFEFWGQCIDELKDNVFLGNDDENPLKHISKITSIVNLFQSPRVSSDQSTKKEKENEQFQKFLRNLEQIHINIPFIEALEQMPKYAKFMKDLLSKKGKGSEASKNKVPHKEKDPGGFTTPYVIGQSGITKALADLGASISLMPYSMFLRLNLGDLKPIRMCIELANKTIQFPKGIAENVMIKIDKFVFLVDFVILDMEEDHIIPIILGRPFFATAHAMIDVFNKKISFEIGDEIITFDLEKSMKFPPSNEDTCHAADIIDLSVINNITEILPQDHDNSIEPILYQLHEIHEDDDNSALFAANSIDDEKTTPKLKELPSHLEYAFLDNNHKLPVIISSLLSDQEKRLLLEVLTKHKKALAWKISDIKESVLLSVLIRF